MKIVFIQTGGTIDKDYPKSIKGYGFEIGEPAVSQILEKLKPAFEYEIVSVLKKDSQDITTPDRELILNACNKADCERIIITHGTDTIIETATFLCNVPKKTIILTGAFLPAKFSQTDADIEIGIAIGAIQTLHFGVYISMNGMIMKWDEAARNPIRGQFIKIEKK